MNKSDYIKQKLEKYNKLIDGKIKEPRIGMGIGTGISANHQRQENANLDGPNQTALQKGVARKKWPLDPTKDESVENRRTVEEWTGGYSNYPRKTRSDIKEMPKNAKERGLHKLVSQTQARRNKKTGEREFLLHRGMGVIEHHGISVNKHSDDMSSWTPDWHKADAFAQDEVAHDVNNEDTGFFTDEIGHEPRIGEHKIHSAWIPESQIHHIPNTIGSASKDVDMAHSIPDNVEPESMKPQLRRKEQEVIVKPHKLNLVDYKHPRAGSEPLNQRINARGLKKADPLQKASKGQMKQMLGEGHDDAINWLSRSVKRDDVQMWFLRNYKKDPSIFNQKNKSDIQHFMSMTGSIKELDTLRLDKTHDFESGMEAFKQAENSGKGRLLDTKFIPASGTKIKDTHDGHAWFDLNKPSCEVEGKAMGHCGNEAEPHPDDKILSLRKEHKYGETKLHEPKATFILNGGKLGEMKGKENNKPHPKYHEAIADLLINHPDIKHLIGGGYEAHKNFEFSDLSQELQDKVLAAKPDIDPLFSSNTKIPYYEDVEPDEGYGEDGVAEEYAGEEHQNQKIIEDHNAFVGHMNRNGGDIDKVIDEAISRIESSPTDSSYSYSKHQGLSALKTASQYRHLTDEQRNKIVDVAIDKGLGGVLDTVVRSKNFHPPTAVIQHIVNSSKLGSSKREILNGVINNINTTPDQANLIAKTGISPLAWKRVTDRDMIDSITSKDFREEQGNYSEERDRHTAALNSLVVNPSITGDDITNIINNNPHTNHYNLMDHKNFTEDHAHDLWRTTKSEYTRRSMLGSDKTPDIYKKEALGSDDHRQASLALASLSNLSSDDLQPSVDQFIKTRDIPGSAARLKEMAKHDLSSDQIHSIITSPTKSAYTIDLDTSGIMGHENVSGKTAAHIINNPDNFSHSTHSIALDHPGLPESLIGKGLGNTPGFKAYHTAMKDHITPDHIRYAIANKRDWRAETPLKRALEDKMKKPLEKSRGDLKFPQLPKLTRPQEEVADVASEAGPRQDRQLRMQAKIGDNRLRQQISRSPDAIANDMTDPSALGSNEAGIYDELSQVKGGGGGKVMQNPITEAPISSIATHRVIKPHEGIHHTVAKLAEHMNGKSDDYDWTPHIYDKMNSFISHGDKKILHDAIAGVEVGGEGYENHEIPHEYVSYMHDLLTSKLHRDHYLGEDHDPRKLSGMKRSYQKIRNWAKTFNSDDFHKEVASMYGDLPLVKSDKIPGGLADDKDPSDFDDVALKEGVKVELEHTTDHMIALEIAMDHLTEDPKYYKKLEVMEKGVARKKYPFNPLKDVDSGERDILENWTMNADPNIRENIPEMNPKAKQRGLNKLSRHTKVRRHKESGEREFLLHRGMSTSEAEGHTSGRIKSLTSWTPTDHIADDFALEDHNMQGTTMSAWIPESQIHHIPSAIGVYHGPDSAFSNEPPNPGHTTLQEFSHEKEIIVKPHAVNQVDSKSLSGMYEDPDSKINIRENSKLQKGAKGDWKKEGYTLSHEYWDSGNFQVHAKDKDGNYVGHMMALPGDIKKNHITSSTTKVKAAHQRKGLATAMYQYAEKVTGKKMKPSTDQSDKGRALWSEGKKKDGVKQFGKSKLKKSDGECPQVASVAVIKGDAILMGKRADNGRWTLPGGHLDAGESPIDGASRELYEESGIKTKDLNHLASEKIDCEDGKTRLIHAFVTFGMYKTRKDLDPDGEISIWKWVPIEDGYLPEEIASNLHSPKNVTLNAIGIKNLKFD